MIARIAVALAGALLIAALLPQAFVALANPVPGPMLGSVPDSMPVFGAAQSQFLLRCGGCHGTLGLSPPKSVPVLRGRVGWFLCTPAGREYIVRVPNVARALLDDGRLAGVLNFVAFDLGEGSAPVGAKAYTGDEISAIRKRPLTDEPLLAHRARVVRELITKCGAPRDLLDYGAAERH